MQKMPRQKDGRGAGNSGCATPGALLVINPETIAYDIEAALTVQIARTLGLEFGWLEVDFRLDAGKVAAAVTFKVPDAASAKIPFKANSEGWVREVTTQLLRAGEKEFHRRCAAAGCG